MSFIVTQTNQRPFGTEIPTKEALEGLIPINEFGKDEEVMPTFLAIMIDSVVYYRTTSPLEEKEKRNRRGILRTIKEGETLQDVGYLWVTTN